MQQPVPIERARDGGDTCCLVSLALYAKPSRLWGNSCCWMNPPISVRNQLESTLLKRGIWIFRDQDRRWVQWLSLLCDHCVSFPFGPTSPKSHPNGEPCLWWLVWPWAKWTGPRAQNYLKSWSFIVSGNKHFPFDLPSLGNKDTKQRRRRCKAQGGYQLSM